MNSLQIHLNVLLERIFVQIIFLSQCFCVALLPEESFPAAL